MNKILVVAPGRKTRGGITSVIKALEQTEIWDKYKCRWIETYIDKSSFYKIIFFIKSFATYLVVLPFYNVVHIHFSWKTSAYRKLFFFTYARLLRKKIILHLHSGAEPIIQSKATHIYQYLFKNASNTVFLANTIKEQIEKHFTIKKSNVIFNPCLIAVSSNQKSEIRKEQIILFAGTITEKKGTDDLILGFSRIAHLYPDWKLVLAGNGEIDKSKILAHKNNITDQVKFTGWISGSDKDELFSKASIFCLPSYTEGFPMAVLDAWAYGLPVLVTPVGGLPDVLIHGENSMVFEPGNIEELKINLELLITNPELRHKLGKASIILSQELFHISKISKKLDELYTNIE